MTKNNNNDIETILKRREDSGGFSIIGLAKNVFTGDETRHFFDYLETLELYGGKTSFGDIPRQQMWVYDGGGNFGDRANWTDLDNPRWVARMYNPELMSIGDRIQKWFSTSFVNALGLDQLYGVNHAASFDSILLNKYRGFGDSIKPHRDSEKIFGNNPSVAILSIGCPREIIFQRILYDPDNLNSVKRDRENDETFRVLLSSGSVLFMGGEVQKYYSHEIKKVKDQERPSVRCGGEVRYSLTFRQYDL